ncbi:MAG TPA: WYL domain-containing protein [Ktedonobacterales bacterium]
MKELDRILGILLALQSQRRISARRLAERFGVSTRTVYRDLRTMSLLGIPIYTERGRNGGIRLLEGYFLPPLMFTRSEAIALLLGVISLRTLRAVPFEADVETATQKLLAAVPEHLRVTLARLGQIIGAEAPPADIFHAEPDEPASNGDPQRDGATVTRFLRAILDGDAVRLMYQSPYRDAPMAMDAEPLGIFWDRGRWYLATSNPGQDEREQERLWRADRVTSISSHGLLVLGERRADFDIGGLLGHAWLRTAMAAWRARAPVRLRITEEQAQRLQRDWYYRFAHYEPDGAGSILMTIGEQDPELVLALVRWLGPGAELLAPVEWRDALREELTAMLRDMA